MDIKALAIIRRMILDAFWSRASSMVEANAQTMQKGCNLSASIGLDPPYLDHCGYGVTAQMLLASPPCTSSSIQSNVLKRFN
jgi:hypothetical protein